MTTAQEETCATVTARRWVAGSHGGCGVAIIRLPVKQLNLSVKVLNHLGFYKTVEAFNLPLSSTISVTMEVVGIQ
jgi:hypothetical protein